MAENHTRAVQEHCDIKDPLARHILEIIALDIGRDESPAFTSNRKLAARARTSVNTARDKINYLIEEGYLHAVKDGKYMFYSLNEELIPYQRISGNNRAKTVGDDIATRDDLSVIVSALSTEINTMIDTKFNTMQKTLYQEIVSIVSALSTNGDPEILGKKEEIREEEEKRKESSLSSLPQFTFSDVASVYGDEIGDFTKTISDELGDYFDDMGGEIIVKAIQEAARQNKRKWAYIKGILRNWKIDGVNPNGRHSSNGHTPVDLWESQVMKWIQRSCEFSNLDPPVQAAIRQVGGESLRAANDYQLEQKRKQFIRILG